MSDIAIRVEKLSKQYRIGAREEAPRNLREAARGLITAPFDYLRRMRRPPSEEETLWALRDLSFEVQRGEALGIIGVNGAGKSTLLKILSRITEPTEGRAEIHGRVGSLLEVGTGFHPELTGRENIYLNGAMLGMRRAEIERRFDEIVAFAEIDRFLDTPVKRYSSGMYVRLGFAVAAHLQPEILLVDEVLAVGDAAFQKKCLGKMGEVGQQGRTVLFVSHNLLALRTLCARAIWLNGGQVVEEGRSEDVVADYLQLQATSVHEQVWDHPASAPGNEVVRLHRVWVEADHRSCDGGMPREAPLTIGVEYWHLDPTAQLHITLQVYVEQQVVAFTTGSCIDPRWQEFAQRPGLLRSTCRIPARLLNTGQHRVKVLVVRDRSRAIYTLEDALSFEVVETAGRSGGWFGKEPGVVLPRLPWTNEYLGQEAEHVLGSESG